MKQIHLDCLAVKLFLFFSLFSLPSGAQSIFQKYGRFLTEPRSYVCYRTDGKLKGNTPQSGIRYRISCYRISFYSSSCITSPERSFGSNQVVFGGIMFPVSAISINCFIETG